MIKILDEADSDALIVSILATAKKLSELRDTLPKDDDAEYVKSMREERKLRHLVDVLIDHDITLEGKRAKEAVTEIKKATVQIKAALDTIKEVKAGIDIAVALIQVAGGVLSKDPGAVITGCENIYNTISGLQKHSATGAGVSVGP
ncbi:MAG: hypothetical protein ACXVB4_19400, partial [Pseudobdellovibrionaceae bacterium]